MRLSSRKILTTKTSKGRELKHTAPAKPRPQVTTDMKTVTSGNTCSESLPMAIGSRKFSKNATKIIAGENLP